MSNNVSSNYGALFGNRVVPNNAAPLNANTAPAVLNQPQDQALISANPAAYTNASVTASPDMRGDLLSLRKELMEIDKQLQQMMRQLDQQQQQPLQPRPATVGDLGDNQPMIPGGPTGPCPNPGPAQVVGSYTIQPGDYLWKVAREQLGDANRWTEIYDLNKDVIGDNPNLMQPGQVLRLPGAKATPRPQPFPANNQLQPQPNFPAQPFPQQNQPFPQQNQPFPQQNQPLPNQPFPQQNQPLPNNQQWPPAPQNNPFPQVPQPLPGVNNNPGVADVAPTATNRNLSDQDAFQVGREFGLLNPNSPLTPDAKANVAAFMDELDSYQTQFRGKVFGPGMESLAQNQQEAQQIQQSVQQIQQALSLLIKSGKLQPRLSSGQPVQDLTLSGTFFKLDQSGQPMRDAQGQPMMDEAFVAAITQFKQDHGLHQSYRLADGSFGINEYVGPNTVEALKQELLKLQGARP